MPSPIFFAAAIVALAVRRDLDAKGVARFAFNRRSRLGHGPYVRGKCQRIHGGSKRSKKTEHVPDDTATRLKSWEDFDVDGLLR